MILRAYKKEDSPMIATWIKTEEELYKWSADRINRFPLRENDIEENYEPHFSSGRFFPLTAEDEEGNVIGHFFIRYPKEDDDSIVRFGYVIVAPEFRGKGYGRKMLLQGIDYVKENLGATRISLGVFENNESARRCYEAIGFKEYSIRDCELPIGKWKCIDMEMYMEGK